MPIKRIQSMIQKFIIQSRKRVSVMTRQNSLMDSFVGLPVILNYLLCLQKKKAN